ncbi:MAG: GIY-YIG nuclease family protein [Parachlamydiaceae bacterium]
MERDHGWVVYIIQNISGKLYTGITNNVDRRFQEHRTGKRGAKFFRLSPAEKILFCEKHPNRSEASKREAAIKKMSRAEKLFLTHS